MVNNVLLGGIYHRIRLFKIHMSGGRSAAGRGLFKMGVNISLTMPFEPKPKLRPRFSVIRGRVHTHTPYATKEFENRVAAYYMEQAKGYKFEQGVPLAISLYFGMPVPKSFTKKKCKLIVAGELWHTVKPDCDNLTKSILDALNEIAWHDDAQITTLKVQKGYSMDGAYIALNIREDMGAI